MSTTEDSDSSSTSSYSGEIESDFEEDFGAVGGVVEPYRFEPIAPENYEEPNEDEDGLTLAILQSRFQGQVNIETWCKCRKCDTNLLSNIQEYRCCKEVGEIMAKLSFEGVESACVIDHPDFDALCNATVLEQVCGMMKDKRGRSYKFPSRGTRNEKNESYRATAYRFLVRWIFGSLGWNTTRPLPSCIYNKMRLQYRTASTRGYSSAEQRQAPT